MLNNMNNVVTVREFWQRKVDNAIVRFYYNGNLGEFQSSMSKLGYDAEEIEGIINNWLDGEDG